MRKFLFIFIVFVSFFPIFAIADTDHLVISQIQITGGAGHTNEDFIEIYNPTSQSIDLNGMRLVKRSKTGTADTLIKSWTDSTLISAHGFYLWANSTFTSIATVPDITTTGTLADDNGIALRQGPNDSGTIIDSVAWGAAANAFVEGSVFAANPGAGQSLERSPGGSDGNAIDINNNSADFFSGTSHPRNLLSPVVPAIVIPPPADPVPDPTSPNPPIPPPASPSSSGSSQPAYSSAVKISEFLPNPEGADSGEEWVELSHRKVSISPAGNWTTKARRGPWGLQPLRSPTEH
jgi:hypothetical protein